MTWMRKISGLPGRAARNPELNLLAFSFLLNFVWEFAQVPGFAGVADMPHWQGIRFCAQAALGDAGLTVLAFWIVAGVCWSRAWLLRLAHWQVVTFLGVGLIATVVLEYVNTKLIHRWGYADWMPVVPGIGIGLLPLLQWLIVPLAVLWIVRRQIRE